MLCYSPLVGGQNGTPVLGLCHFISEKNVVQAPRVFKVNSYIELCRLIPLYPDAEKLQVNQAILRIFRLGQG